MSHRPFALLAILCATALAVPARAETFDVLLGGRKLGTLDYSASGKGAALGALLDNTPLGVADGTFDATSQPVRTPEGALVRQFVARTDERTVSVLLDDGTVTETRISPKSERTALSDPAKVPADVIDPVRAFGRFLQAGDCPQPFRMYDGRRVISISTTGSEPAEGGGTKCLLDYRVTAGPGHLSPLGISSLSMTLTYREGRMTEVTGRTGPFTLRFAR